MNPWAAVPEAIGEQLARLLALVPPWMRATAEAACLEVLAIARETEKQTRVALDEAAAREQELEAELAAHCPGAGACGVCHRPARGW